jgi:hypothetical protein
MQEPLRGSPSRCSEETNFPSEKSKHRSKLLPTFRVFFFITTLCMYLLVHLRIGVQWNPSLHHVSFHVTLFLL